ncbi:acetyl-CoA carboxylase biotin carboxyl carrier protein [Polaromonas hydrogenivorans]|uniref:Biotin carboxyl carrier protein of acetyl-CoA carboxylase n=1 Tax=Polaromonas hydrogenivorans TaxID=335476 RepID=A0AAU7M049_9BURK
MSLSHEDVMRLLQLLDASQFDELHLETDGTKLTLRRNSTHSAALPASAVSSSFAPATVRPVVQPLTSAAPPAPAAKTSLATDLVDVRAAMLGTLYGSPKPGAAPFVSVGSKVERNTVIGIIEVMKLMNSISAGVDGEVVEILARDGDLVEFDQVLMRIRPV